jgi:hypothetical protein
MLSDVSSGLVSVNLGAMRRTPQRLPKSSKRNTKALIADLGQDGAAKSVWYAFAIREPCHVHVRRGTVFPTAVVQFASAIYQRGSDKVALLNTLFEVVALSLYCRSYYPSKDGARVTQDMEHAWNTLHEARVCK